MGKTALKPFLIIIFITLTGLVSQAYQSSNNEFTLHLTGLKNNQEAPLYCISTSLGGKNISPEVTWKNPPKDTKSFVLTCIDKNPVANNWVHWMLLNIPSSERKIPENGPVKGIICNNSFGYPGYGGPQPPKGTGDHKYVFTLYALDKILKDVTANSFYSEAVLLNMIKGNIIDKSTFVLNYKNS
ncbi:MAG: YbhB/YbcL family Raf kinase inhibitor-like protein [Victivallales bacterium]|nr:YbhB/YbcL family Raf kinase inhibitor-like protein [Victivallales bacterium]MCF7889390.1 YbhB/YbcL family Raf kinase inhibitor-like protein [Victivallales bacterium]